MRFQGFAVRRRWRQRRRQLYSQHVAPPTKSTSASVTWAHHWENWTRPRSRPVRWGLLTLLMFGLALWAIVELGHLPALVEAQEVPAQTAPAPKSLWASASFPVEKFVAYTSPFGYRNHPFGGRSFHYGLDIAAPMGSYVKSWWEGQLVEVTDDTACGTGAVIQSDDWLHIYCHLQGYVVVEKDGDRWLVDRDGGIEIRQGDLINTGQRIGRIGMTGRTTGPHLHWGMKYRGTWIDPAPVVKAMVDAAQK